MSQLRGATSSDGRNAGRWSPAGHRALLPFALLYTALFGAYGTTSAFTPAFLGSHGLPVEQIGWVLAAGTVAKIGAGPALGRLADRLRAHRGVVAAAAALSGTVGTVYLFTFGLGPLLLTTLAWSASTASLAPLSDALALAAAHGPGGFRYGWVRGIGSGAFVVGTLVSGQGVDRFGLGFTVLASSVLFLAMAFCTILVPASDPPARSDDTGAFRTLLGRKDFRRLLLVAALVIGSHAVNDGFAVIRWREVGLGGGTVSLLWSESVAAEVAVFFVVGPWLLDRLGPARAIGLSACAGIVRWSVLGATVAVPALAAVQTLHGLTFALLHLAAMVLITRSVSPALTGTAQTVYGTFALGIASAVLTFVSGYLYGWIGMRAFWAMALLCCLALPLTRGLAGDKAVDPARPT